MNIIQPYHEQDHEGGLVWIKKGKSFAFDDIVFYKDKGKKSFEEVAAQIDLIITGPHSTAAIPRELEPFMSQDFSQRKQYDFSDVSTFPIGRKWAELDERVVFIEDPHPRLIFDQNRPRPSDAAAQLTEAFARLAAQTKEKPASMSGVDAIRPVTFGGAEVLKTPAGAEDIQQLTHIILEVAESGSFFYAKTRDQVIETVFEKKGIRLATLDLDNISLKDFNSACMLHIHSLHDTMNTKIMPDGAVTVERPPADQMPLLVSLANRGGVRGELRYSSKGALPDLDTLSMPAAELRKIAASYAACFEIPAEKLEETIWLNRPYFGGLEVQLAGDRVRKLSARGQVLHQTGDLLSLHVAAFQSEFLREAMMGAKATVQIKTPGVDWPEIDEEHVDQFTRKCAAAHDMLRVWNRM